MTRTWGKPAARIAPDSLLSAMLSRENGTSLVTLFPIGGATPRGAGREAGSPLFPQPERARRATNPNHGIIRRDVPDRPPIPFSPRTAHLRSEGSFGKSPGGTSTGGIVRISVRNGYYQHERSRSNTKAGQSGLSRKYTIPLLEHFDGTKVTLRVGDKRVLRKGK